MIAGRGEVKGGMGKDEVYHITYDSNNGPLNLNSRLHKSFHAAVHMRETMLPLLNNDADLNMSDTSRSEKDAHCFPDTHSIFTYVLH